MSRAFARLKSLFYFLVFDKITVDMLTGTFAGIVLHMVHLFFNLVHLLVRHPGNFEYRQEKAHHKTDDQE